MELTRPSTLDVRVVHRVVRLVALSFGPHSRLSSYNSYMKESVITLNVSSVQIVASVAILRPERLSAGVHKVFRCVDVGMRHAVFAVLAWPVEGVTGSFAGSGHGF